MTEKPENPKQATAHPESRKTAPVEQKTTPAAGEGAAANDPPEKPGDDEETMPIEEGFSIVP